MRIFKLGGGGGGVYFPNDIYTREIYRGYFLRRERESGRLARKIIQDPPRENNVRSGLKSRVSITRESHVYRTKKTQKSRC